MNTTNSSNTTIDPSVLLAELEAKEDMAEIKHETDADEALLLNVALILCILLTYLIKKKQWYAFPESSASLLIGVVLGVLARFFFRRKGVDEVEVEVGYITNTTTTTTSDVNVNVDESTAQPSSSMAFFSFSPEFFFFILLPPIIFEAGYSLKRQNFFENLGAILCYAFLGTMISTFCVGYLTFAVAKLGWVSGIDGNDPMEALLFGALISAIKYYKANFNNKHKRYSYINYHKTLRLFTVLVFCIFLIELLISVHVFLTKLMTFLSCASSFNNLVFSFFCY